MSDEYDFNPEPDGLSLKEVAVRRWKAVEGFLMCPDISPLAARLGALLICHMDASTRACYVGEIRLSIELHAHILSVQKAKRELRDKGLINWTNPGGPRHRCLYSFNFSRLLRLQTEADVRAIMAIDDARVKRANNSRGAGTNSPDRNSRGAVIAPFSKSASGNSDTAVSDPRHSQNGFHHSRGAGSSTAVGLADITPDIAHQDIAQRHHDVSSETAERCAALKGDDLYAVMLDDFLSPDEPKEVAPKKSKKEGARPYPRLFHEFGNELLMFNRLERMNIEEQAKASRLLATEGAAVAREFILGRRP